MKLATLFLGLVILSFSCGQNQQSEGTPIDTATSNASDTNTPSKSSDQQSQNTDTKSSLKVYVGKSGNIIVDGEASSLNDLDNRLKILKTKNGIVYYSRDNVAGDPPQQSMQVMELVTKYELPVKFYTDKTFTQPVKIN